MARGGGATASTSAGDAGSMVTGMSWHSGGKLPSSSAMGSRAHAEIQMRFGSAGAGDDPSTPLHPSEAGQAVGQESVCTRWGAGNVGLLGLSVVPFCVVQCSNRSARRATRHVSPLAHDVIAPVEHLIEGGRRGRNTCRRRGQRVRE